VSRIGEAGGAAPGGLAAHPVVQDQEGQPEDGKGVLSLQFAVLGVDVELLGEAVNRQRREGPAVRVDVGEVVAGLVQVAAAGQDQAAAGYRPPSTSARSRT
jgi:hypothetical protein